jgi:hypothetical protein
MIPEDPNNLTDQKERIFRQLQREADREEKAALEGRHSNGTSSADGTSGDGGTTTTNTAVQTRYPFRWGDVFKSAAFGGCIGVITGSVFGFMDGMRIAGQSEVLKNASNMAKGKYLMEGTTRSATVFGVFFGGFHTVKYGIRVAMDPGEFAEVAMASAVSLGALMYKPSFRPAMPYASMLILMDSVHLMMRQFNKD